MAIRIEAKMGELLSSTTLRAAQVAIENNNDVDFCFNGITHTVSVDEAVKLFSKDQSKHRLDVLATRIVRLKSDLYAARSEYEEQRKIEIRIAQILEARNFTK